MRAGYLFSVAVLLLPIHLLRNKGPEVLKTVKEVKLDELQGPVGHMAVDVAGQRIFLAATGNNTIEIYNAQTLEHLGTIEGLSQPQDLAYLPESGKLLVSNGADGSLRTYDAKSLKLLDSKVMGGDADRIQVVPGGKSVIVGWGVGGLAFIDLESGKRQDIQLKSHPDSFVVDSKGNHIFVNLPGVNEISVIDRRSQTTIESWEIKQHDNGPIALDEGNRRIFVVSRKPPRLLVLNMDDGSVMATMSTVEEADDIFYDRERKRVYVVGGEGLVAVYQQKSPDEYTALARTDSVVEARTGLFVPQWNRLYAAARNRPPVFPAELLSFAILDN